MPCVIAVVGVPQYNPINFKKPPGGVRGPPPCRVARGWVKPRPVMATPSGARSFWDVVVQVQRTPAADERWRASRFQQSESDAEVRRHLINVNATARHRWLATKARVHDLSSSPLLITQFAGVVPLSEYERADGRPRLDCKY